MGRSIYRTQQKYCASAIGKKQTNVSLFFIVNTIFLELYIRHNNFLL